MAEQITQVIPTFTTTPNRNQPATFSADTDQYHIELAPFTSAMNTFSTQANALSTEVSTKATEAEASATSASASAAIATASANYKGDWSAGYNGGLGYSLNDSVSYTDGFNYVSKVNSNTTEPTSQTNTTEWNYIEAFDAAQYYTKTQSDANFGTKTQQDNNTTNILSNTRKDLSVIHDITVDSDYTLTTSQNQYGRIEITDTSVFLTTGRNIIVDNIEHTFLFVNSTAQTLTVKTSAGTGIAVDAGEAIELRNDTVNVILSKSNGKLLQRVYAEDGTYGTGTTILPNDNTIPQQTEGNEIITASITPKSATSRLLVTASVFCGETTNVTSSLAGALFRDSTSDAISSMITVSDTAGSSIVQGQVVVIADVPSTSTSLTTFKLRAGLPAAGTLFWNGLQGLGAVHGGTMKATITILEVEA